MLRDSQDSSHHSSRPFITGSFHPIQLLGPGPLSRTYLAAHPNYPGETFALKVLQAVPLLSDEMKEEVLQEIVLRKALQHPSIAPIRAYWVEEQILSIATPYVKSGSLRQRTLAGSGTPLSVKEALAILTEVGQALHYAHQQGFAHADLKPENVLIKPDGHVWLADFLLPALIKSPRAARSYATLTARYMAPEQFLEGVGTPLSDQYALACLACELLLGAPPFEADDLEGLARKHLNDQPIFYAFENSEQVQHLGEFILRALSRDPADRFPNVQAFIDKLNTPPSLVPYIQTVMLPSVTIPDAQPALVLTVPSSLQGPANSPTSVDVPLDTAQTSKTPAVRPSTGSASRSAAPSRLSTGGRPRWFIAALIATLLAVCLSTGLVAFKIAFSGPANTVPAGITQSSISTGNLTTLPHTNTAVTPTVVGEPTQTTSTAPTPTIPASPAVTPTGTTNPAVTGCAVHYAQTSSWNNGFVANIQITNAGSTPIQTWTLAFRLTNHERITNGWSGTFRQIGEQISVTDAGYNGQLPPNASTTIGFQATSDGQNSSPMSFTLNGMNCGVV